MTTKKILYHPWAVAAQNFLLIMIIFSLSRLFFYFINTSMYPDMSFSHLLELLGGGIRFDLTALLYLNSAYILMEILPFHFRENQTYQKVARWLYWIPNALAIIVNCIDMVYVRFTDRRTTITFFSEFQNDGNLFKILMTSIVQYWYVSLFCIAMIVLLVLFTRRKVIISHNTNKLVYYATETVLMCVTIYFVVIGIRGGFGAFTRPITLSNALQYTNHPNETNIVLNTPFSLMRSTEGKIFPKVHYFENQQDVERIMTPLHPKNEDAVFNKKNVVVFILESFSKEFFGYFNHDLDNGTYKGYTPFLDSLAANAVTFDLSFASGRKSIDAMPSVLSSIPMIIAPYILTSYSTNDVSSIADCLHRSGYYTAFFHGAPNGSMGFQAYSRTCGFEDYFGKTEYNNNSDYDGYWAIWDEEFLQYYARKMSEMQEPFMTAVFTATSHHPFQVPDRYKGVFPEGTHPLHHCIGYTDNAMRRFFDYAKTQPWYNNTLFVITADHTNGLTRAEYTTDKGFYEVPIIFFDPEMTEEFCSIKREYPVSQTDIMPSVLAYLGYDKPYFAFGQDALTTNKEIPYVVCYNNPLYQIFSDSLLLQFDGEKTTAIYNFKNDRYLRKNIREELKESDKVNDMELYLKAYIQQYINRMKNNELTYGSED